MVELPLMRRPFFGEKGKAAGLIGAGTSLAPLVREAPFSVKKEKSSLFIMPPKNRP